MADLISLVICGLAAYRVATDLAWEAGPDDLFERLRGAVIAWRGPDDWLSRGVTCPICLGLWVALAMVAVWAWLPALVLWLAAAGLVALLTRIGGGA